MSCGVTFGRPSTDLTTSSSAPSARTSWKRSSVKQSAITIRHRYPFARQTSASAGPVLPPVYSTTVSPECSRPSRSAPSIIATAIRSFIEPDGFRYSSFTHSSAPFAGAHRVRRTSGVFPMAARIEWRMASIMHEEPSTVVLVEGASDRAAVLALADRRGHDLRAEGVEIVAIGGAHALRRVVTSLD